MAINSISNLTDSTVAGSNTQIQYNNSGVFGASSNLTFDGSTLTVTGDVSQSGNYTNTALPAFSAGLAGGVSNVTGDGTVYTVVFDTERFDQGNDFDGTSTFTAPVTGKYQLNFFIMVTNINTPNTHTDIAGYIKTSNQTYLVNYSHGSTVAYSYFSMSFSVLADMDAGDTAFIDIWSSGSNKDVGIYASASYNNFSGHLVC